MGMMLFVLHLICSVIALVLAVLAGIQTWEHRRFARSRLDELHRCAQNGPAVIIAPCRGLDEEVEENLRTLFLQDYGDYEIRFVVETVEDPIYPIIRRLMAAHPGVRSQVLVAGRATTCGQKVHNLRVATGCLPERVEYLAFVDSDARLRQQWLRALVSRLDGCGVGASTGYRWFVPAEASLANRLLYSINTSVATSFGLHSLTVVWGGSWAMRRELFESLGVRDAWEGTLSDDLIVSRLLRRARLRVLFEPACMVASPLNATREQLSSFVRRQYLMGRFYLPRWWALTLLLATLITLPMVANLTMLVWDLATGSTRAWLSGGLSGALYCLGVPTGLFRQDLVRLYCPQHYGDLRWARRFEVWAGPLVNVVNWIEMLGSSLGRRITWRGIGYRLARDGRVTKIWHVQPQVLAGAVRPAAEAFREEDTGPAAIQLPSDLARAA
jgi:ceramide glucosyltransferase